MEKYILAESWGRPNIQSRTWYAQDTDARDALETKETIVAGDKCYIIENAKMQMMGFDGEWYDM